MFVYFKETIFFYLLFIDLFLAALSQLLPVLLGFLCLQLVEYHFIAAGVWFILAVFSRAWVLSVQTSVTFVTPGHVESQTMNQTVFPALQGRSLIHTTLTEKSKKYVYF